MSTQELSPSQPRHRFEDLTDEQIVAVVQQFLLLEGAWKRKPADLAKQTFYGTLDFWYYMAISDDKTCWTCDAILNNSVLAGIDLRQLFPFHIIISGDQILPMVHPNCRCTLFRVTDISDYLDITTAPVDVYFGVPPEQPSGPPTPPPEPPSPSNISWNSDLQGGTSTTAASGISVRIADMTIRDNEGDAVDVHKEYAEPVVNELNRLPAQDIEGIQKITFIEMAPSTNPQISAAYAWYNHDNKEVTFQVGNMAMADPNDYGPRDEFAQMIVDHEVGHNVYDSLDASQQDTWKEFWRENRDIMPTDYGQVNASEGFAEAYAQFRETHEEPVDKAAFAARVMQYLSDVDRYGKAFRANIQGQGPEPGERP